MQMINDKIFVCLECKLVMHVDVFDSLRLTLVYTSSDLKQGLRGCEICQPRSWTDLSVRKEQGRWTNSRANLGGEAPLVLSTAG
jgi:hypothetical protein